MSEFDIKGSINDSLRELIDVHTHVISDNILSYEEKLRIGSLSSNFPKDISKDFIFESRLSFKDRATDFCLKVKKDKATSLRKFVKSKLNSRNRNLFNNLLNFLNSWIDTIEFDYIIELLWLEYDMTEKMNNDDFPLIYFQLSKNFQENILKCIPALKTIIKVLHPYVTKTALDNLERCFFCLPKGSMIKHIGIAPSRNINDVRVCIFGLRKKGIVEILNAIPLVGSLSYIQKIIGPLDNMVDSFSLHLDVGDVFGSKIGVELRKNMVFKDSECWNDIARYLKQSKLILDDKSNEVCRLHHKINDHGITYLEGFETYYCLLYIKLIFGVSNYVQAKAYIVATSQSNEFDINCVGKNA
ncbi:hypothetical protein [Microbulbifer epialgicus]|uniref:Uncharacterized protein n=1 Tax=Microbulbifer epialgicus TaxID=393907 RepID=A0ABV4P3T0_9GAMM